MPDKALPRNLQGRRHEDFPWPFSLIPRGWTAFNWGLPEEVFGNTNYLKDCVKVNGNYITKPITSPGTWQVSHYPDGPWFAWYFAFTTKGGTHFRVGARWDSVDNYTEFPTVAIKRGIV